MTSSLKLDIKFQISSGLKKIRSDPVFSNRVTFKKRFNHERLLKFNGLEGHSFLFKKYLVVFLGFIDTFLQLSAGYLIF